MTAGVDFERSDAELAAAAAGVTTEEVEYVDYFGFEKTARHMLPDGKQWFEFKVLNEGEVAELQSASNSEVIVQRVTGDAKMKVDQAKDRHNLIAKSVCNWYLVRKSQQDGTWQPLGFPVGGSNQGTVQNKIKDMIKQLPPKIVSDLEQAIRKANPGIGGEPTVEEIEKQLDMLQEELDKAKKREQGK